VAGVNPILAGLTCRCPNCGKGALFSGYLKLNDRCPSCDFDLKAADPGDGPAVFVILICGAIACFGLLFTEIAFHPPVWVHLVTWFPGAALLCLAALPVFKAVLIALQFHNKASLGRLEK
jgi:uncharacterized protein (DUF983 family)